MLKSPLSKSGFKSTFCRCIFRKKKKLTSNSVMRSSVNRMLNSLVARVTERVNRQYTSNVASLHTDINNGLIDIKRDIIIQENY